MSELQPISHTIYNQRDQFVELHFGTYVKVLPPYDTMEVDTVELASPQLQSLVQRRLIVVRAPLEAPPTSEIKATSDVKETKVEGESPPEVPRP